MLSERFNWDRLRVFRLVADAQSMTAASKTLGESAPTISRRINDLERELGTKLFSRSKRGVELTAAGKRLMDLVEQMQGLVDTVGDQVSHTDTSVAGAIKIKASDGLGPHWLARHLPAFHQTLPNLQIDLEVGLAKEEDVVDREADLAIVFEKPKHPEVISQRLGTLHYICFASEAYLQTNPPPQTVFDMQKHKLLMHSDYVHQAERWSKNIKELKEFIDYSTITNSSTALLTLCQYGGGIAVMPTYAAELDPALVPMALPPAAPIEFWITYTERVRRNPAGMAALEWLMTIFNDVEHPWFGRSFIHPSNWDGAHAPTVIKCADRDVSAAPLLTT
ncbi:MAG: LysR family transcriptional regulator [Hyphomonadaceae bacterium]|nr:LysR family transcriptional regulator [Hyphomonadaceae bacterium]